MIYAAIVLLPLAGALIAGLFGRAIGDRPSEVITTALLFIAAALSWVAGSWRQSAWHTCRWLR